MVAHVLSRKPSADRAVLCNGNEQQGIDTGDVARALAVVTKWLPRLGCDGSALYLPALDGSSFLFHQDPGRCRSTPERRRSFLFGGGRMSGFLVVADDQPLRDDVPSLNLTDFSALIGQSRVEMYQDLIHPILPPLPFGFLFAPRLEKGSSSLSQYIVPAEVVERRNVQDWHFELKRWGYGPNGYGRGSATLALTGTMARNVSPTSPTRRSPHPPRA